MANRGSTIDVLLNLVPDNADLVISHLQEHSELASKQDRHGYSLLHAATSYEQLNLLRNLIENYGIDPNLTDEDGETCLFNAESVDFAKELIKLGVDVNAKNSDGQTAADRLDDEDEQPLVAAYLREVMLNSDGTNSSATIETANVNGTLVNGDSEAAHPPPPLPRGVEVTVGTMSSDEVGDEPDPEFRRRIEELAARADFQGAESQQELRDLVSDAISGFNHEGQGSATRRRLG